MFCTIFNLRSLYSQRQFFFFFFAFFSFGVTNNKQTKDSDKWQKLRVQDQLVTYILLVLKTVIHALMSSNRHEAKRNETKQTKKERKDRKKNTRGSNDSVLVYTSV